MSLRPSVNHSLCLICEVPSRSLGGDEVAMSETSATDPETLQLARKLDAAALGAKDSYEI